MNVVAMKQQQHDLVRTPEELAPLIKEQIELGDLAATEAGMPYYRKAGGMMWEAKPSLPGTFQAWCKKVTGRSLSVCNLYIKAYKEQVAAIEHSRNGRQKSKAYELSDSLASLAGHRPSGRVFREWTEPVDDMAERARKEQERQSAEQKLKQLLARKLIDIGYKILAQELHPDKGGSNEAMVRLKAVRDRLKQVYG